ncbi:MAG TPA: hypothetical protein VEB19_02625 [Gemmatimonadaceae bacterium]|nr:hypothetical protein [Gemmatimonadaceae bacterium]
MEHVPGPIVLPSWKQPRRPWRWVGVIALVVAFTLVYDKATAEPEAWVVIARDAHYDVEIDRARTKTGRMASQGRWVNVVETWYRTSHKLPRLHKGKEFDREVVRSVVRCDNLTFKVASIAMSRGNGRPITRQVTSGEELYRQRWRPVERGTTEEIAAQAACHFGDAAAPSTAER